MNNCPEDSSRLSLSGPTMSLIHLIDLKVAFKTNFDILLLKFCVCRFLLYNTSTEFLPLCVYKEHLYQEASIMFIFFEVIGNTLI
jgi:hypothetical protein